MKSWDPGEIIKNHAYVRQIYSSKKKENGAVLFSSCNLIKQLLSIYTRMGIHPLTIEEIHVNVKLPNHSNPIYSNWWHETVMKKTVEQPYVLKFDRLLGYIKNEVLLASREWIRDFELKPGEEAIISPCIPVPELGHCIK
jgi:hypothetical protein